MSSSHTPPSDEHFELRDLTRLEQFESEGFLHSADSATFKADTFGGAKDALAFPFIMAATSVFLAMVFASTAVELGLSQSPDHFVLVFTGLAALTAVPLAVVAGLRERRKWRSYEAVRSVAAVDPLTGLLNRRSFSVSLDEELKRMSRTGHSAAIILFDLDRFKKLNDQFGHHLGDEVLTKIASIAYAELRNPFDRLARWGGEEFIILLHDMTEDNAKLVCERLRVRIEQLEIEHKGADVPVTASFGGSLLHPNQPFEEALNRADKALYSAKSNGRNRIEFKRHLIIAA